MERSACTFRAALFILFKKSFVIPTWSQPILCSSPFPCTALYNGIHDVGEELSTGNRLTKLQLNEVILQKQILKQHFPCMIPRKSDWKSIMCFRREETDTNKWKLFSNRRNFFLLARVLLSLSKVRIRILYSFWVIPAADDEIFHQNFSSQRGWIGTFNSLFSSSPYSHSQFFVSLAFGIFFSIRPSNNTKQFPFRFASWRSFFLSLRISNHLIHVVTWQQLDSTCVIQHQTSIKENFEQTSLLWSNKKSKFQYTARGEMKQKKSLFSHFPGPSHPKQDCQNRNQFR